MQPGDFPATRVNGSFMPNFIGKRVVLIGTFMKIIPGGRAMEIRTSDDRIVSVQLPAEDGPPASHALRLVEVNGVVTGKNTVKASSYTEFPEEMSENFDLEGYDECVQVINTLPNPWRLN